MKVCTLLQTDNPTSTPPLSFLQARCPSCHPTNSVKALKATNFGNNTNCFVLYEKKQEADTCVELAAWLATDVTSLQ